MKIFPKQIINYLTHIFGISVLQLLPTHRLTCKPISIYGSAKDLYTSPWPIHQLGFPVNLQHDLMSLY